MQDVNLMGFAGKRVLVTGGGSGIGQGIALGFAQAAAKVAVLGRRKEVLEQTLAQMPSPSQGLVLCADVRHPEEVDAAFGTLVEQFGGLDVVINAAAGNFLCAAADLSLNGLRSVLEIDLLGTFHICRKSLPLLQKQEGSCIVNISATLHYGGTPMQLHVSAAKAGIDALTRNLAVEWGPLGIRVNAVAPGPIDDTEGMRRLASEQVRQKMQRDVPLKRLGRIADVVAPTLFLCSQAASFVHGTVLVVDGGRSLNLKMFASPS